MFLNEPRFTTATGWQMTPDGGAAELLEAVDADAELLKLKAVFTTGPATNEVYLPTGAYGELHVNAGNAGVSGDDFLRGASAGDAHIDDPLLLDSAFSRALLAEFSQWSAGVPLSDKVREVVNGHDGAPPRFPGGDYPVQGWWDVSLTAKSMAATFRQRRWDGSFHDVYTVSWNRRDGWTSTTP